MDTRLATLLFFFSLNSLFSQNIFTIDDIANQVNVSLHKNDKSYNFKNAESKLIWSLLHHTDSIAIIGYKPEEEIHIRPRMHEIDFSSSAWQKSKEDVLQFIKEYTNKKYSLQLETKDLIAKKSLSELPFFFVKLYDQNLIDELRALPEVRYIEPANTDLEALLFRSGEGCSNYSQNLSTNDYSNISPESVQAWNHSLHNVANAWTKSDAGKDIWMAVMDTGVSDENPKFNGDFDEGESAGRSIEKKGFYQNDGWIDQCGHGSAMAGIAAGPRGYDDTPAGIAYQANLVSYRVTNDVITNGSDEINGLAAAIYDAADDTRIKVISISLGDVFSHGPMEDAIVYASGKGKLIFCAAGTSLSWTNWYGVIAPADMDETVAVTGVEEGTNFTECYNCHYGSKVDFSIYMERSSSGNTVPTLSNDIGNGYAGYVGGSSAATAFMAGIATMTWANFPNFERGQILNRLIQTSSRYPNKDDDFGWGAPDACAAVDTSASLPCASSISNNVVMEIYEITFPSTSDNLFDGTAEWVVKLNNVQSYYFEVPTSGATGSPSSYNNTSVCDAAPISINLGNTVCSQSSITITLETHEDDGASSDCNFDSGDDDQTITNPSVQFGSNTFTQNTSNGLFSFKYSLYCTPLLVASLTDDSPKCYGTTLTADAQPTGASNYHFFHDINDNGNIDAGESLQNGSASQLQTNVLDQGSVLTVIITDGVGCFDTTSIRPNIIPSNYMGQNMLTGIESGNADYETDGIIESDQTIDATAIVDYDSGTEIRLLPGFTTVVGAQFEAFIDGCDFGGGGLNQNEDHPEDIENDQ